MADREFPQLCSVDSSVVIRSRTILKKLAPSQLLVKGRGCEVRPYLRWTAIWQVALLKSNYSQYPEDPRFCRWSRCCHVENEVPDIQTALRIIHACSFNTSSWVVQKGARIYLHVRHNEEKVINGTCRISISGQKTTSCIDTGILRRMRLDEGIRNDQKSVSWVMCD